MNKSQKLSTDLTKNIENFHVKLLLERVRDRSERQIQQTWTRKTLHFASEYNKTYDTKSSGIVQFTTGFRTNLTFVEPTYNFWSCFKEQRSRLTLPVLIPEEERKLYFFIFTRDGVKQCIWEKQIKCKIANVQRNDQIMRHHNVYGLFCLHFFITVYKHTLNSCFYQRKTLLLFSTLYSKLFMAISTLSLRE